MISARLIVAEARAGELLALLSEAVAGGPRWRTKAALLLVEIDNLVLPERTRAALIDADDRKRATEQMEDLCHE